MDEIIITEEDTALRLDLIAQSDGVRSLGALAKIMHQNREIEAESFKKFIGLLTGKEKELAVKLLDAFIANTTHVSSIRDEPTADSNESTNVITRTGTVKWYNSQKGFGFIAPDHGGKDVFVHATALEAAGLRGLKDGQVVSFVLTEERGKPSVVKIKIAN